MESSAQRNFKIFVTILFLLFLGNLIFLDWKVLIDVPKPAQEMEEVQPTITPSVCDQVCQDTISLKVAEAVASLSATPKAQIITQTSRGGTTYIPLNGTSSTKGTSWVDIPATDVYIKAEDYGKGAYISFEASIKAGHPGGQAYARLFDVTHSIAVDGSELSTGSQSFTQVSSGNLPFWNGNNLYRVQIRSVDIEEVFYSSGRIKIVTK